MVKIWLCSRHRLHYYVLDFTPQFSFVRPTRLQNVQDCAKRALVASFLFAARLLTGLVSSAELVDGVVGKVHVEVVHISHCGLLVGLSAEACEALLVNVDTQGAHTVEEHVNTQVILQTIDQVRRIHVALDDPAADPILILGLLDRMENALESAAQKNTSTLGERVRLCDVRVPYPPFAAHRPPELVAKV